MPPPISSTGNSPVPNNPVAPSTGGNRFTAFIGKIASALQSIGHRHDTHVQPLHQRHIAVADVPLQAPIKLLRQAVQATDQANTLKTEIARLEKEIQHESLGLEIHTFAPSSLKKVETHVTDPAAFIHNDAKFDKVIHQLGNQIGLNEDVSSFDPSSLKKVETHVADPLAFLRDDPNKDKLLKNREKFDDHLKSKLEKPPALKPTTTKVAPTLTATTKVQGQLDAIHDETVLRPQPLKSPTEKANLLAEPTLGPISKELATTWSKPDRKLLSEQLGTKFKEHEKLIATGDKTKAKLVQTEVLALADQLGKTIGKTFAQHSPSSQSALALGTGGPLKTELWAELQAANKKLPSWNYQGPDSDYDGGEVPRDNSLQKKFLDRVYSSAVAQLDTRIDSGQPPLLTYKGTEYKPVKLLGSGGGGAVYLYADNQGNQVALKLLKSQEYTTGFEAEGVRKEFKTHLALMGSEGKGHEHLLNIKGVARSPEGTPAAILELAPLGDMKKLTEDKLAVAEKHGLVSPKNAQLIRLLAFRDALDGMIYLQEKLGARHGDLKPGNFFIGADAKIKAADFGTSTFEKTQKLTKDSAEGTFLYQAPEQFIPGATFSAKADTWALGVMAHQIFKKAFPFSSKYVGAHSEALAQYAAKGDVTGARGVVSQMAKDFDQSADVLGVTSLDRLLNAMMHPDPDKRPALSSLIQSSLFDDLGQGANSLTPAVRELIRALMADPQDEALIKQKSDALGE